MNLYTYAKNNPVRYVDPLGLLVIIGERPAVVNNPYNPGSHTTIIIIPDEPGAFYGDPHFQLNNPRGVPTSTLSAGPGGNALTSNLIKTLNDSADQLSNMRSLREVQPPSGINDTQFIRDLLRAYDSYKNNLLYRDYNSNSFTRGLLKAAGEPNPPNPPNAQPGWNNPIPLPSTGEKK